MPAVAGRLDYIQEAYGHLVSSIQLHNSGDIGPIFTKQKPMFSQDAFVSPLFISFLISDYPLTRAQKQKLIFICSTVGLIHTKLKFS